MIPKAMELFLRERLPTQTWRNRTIHEGGLAFMEFNSKDVERLARLDIEVDRLGPLLVVCLWDESSPLEIGGYLVVDNLAMGRPSMGGIRMLPDITPAAILNLARGMTLKNAAADLPYGGGKSGIVSSRYSDPEVQTQVISGFARLLRRYTDIYLPGPDVGTNDSDMKTLAAQIGLDNALSKPVEMGGNRIDQLGAAAGGVVIALEALLEEMPRLSILPQFRDLSVPTWEDLTLLIQGFGAVGAHAARILCEQHRGCRITGISDKDGCLFDPNGLPVQDLVQRWETNGVVTKGFYLEAASREPGTPTSIKFSSSPDDLLREWGFCLIPAAPIANYLDTDPQSNASMTTDRMGHWALIIEGANTYSPDPGRLAARSRMEREVFRRRGILIATDYLVNSGGVIFAAQEHQIKTPEELRIPDELLGHRLQVDRWLEAHQKGFERLADQRRKAAVKVRDQVIRRNMRELIDLLISDADMLPAEAAERISVRRIAAHERDRRVRDIMEPVPKIDSSCSLDRAAALLIESESPILAILEPSGRLSGVVTEWDITRAMAHGSAPTAELGDMMTVDVVTAHPEDRILDVVRKLENFEISAMPVVDPKGVQGFVSTDILARTSLLTLLQSETEP